MVIRFAIVTIRPATQQVGGSNGKRPELMHEISCRGSRGTDFQTLQNLRPRKRVEFIVNDAEVSQEKFYFRSGEEVGAGNLEMRHANRMQPVADDIGIVIGVDHNGGGLRLVVRGKPFRQQGHIVNLCQDIARAAQAQAGVVGIAHVAWFR